EAPVPDRIEERIRIQLSECRAVALARELIAKGERVNDTWRTVVFDESRARGVELPLHSRDVLGVRRHRSHIVEVLRRRENEPREQRARGSEPDEAPWANRARRAIRDKQQSSDGQARCPERWDEVVAAR